jgi:hypothetical protein
MTRMTSHPRTNAMQNPRQSGKTLAMKSHQHHMASQYNESSLRFIPPENLDQAKFLIRCLKGAGLDFHFEDDPAEIINGQTGKPLFAPSDIPLVREMVSCLYKFDWGKTDDGEDQCPIGYLVSLGD